MEYVYLRVVREHNFQKQFVSKSEIHILLPSASIGTNQSHTDTPSHAHDTDTAMRPAHKGDRLRRLAGAPQSHGHEAGLRGEWWAWQQHLAPYDDLRNITPTHTPVQAKMNEHHHHHHHHNNMQKSHHHGGGGGGIGGGGVGGLTSDDGRMDHPHHPSHHNNHHHHHHSGAGLGGLGGPGSGIGVGGGAGIGGSGGGLHQSQMAGMYGSNGPLRSTSSNSSSPGGGIGLGSGHGATHSNGMSGLGGPLGGGGLGGGSGLGGSGGGNVGLGGGMGGNGGGHAHANTPAALLVVPQPINATKIGSVMVNGGGPGRKYQCKMCPQV